MILSRDDLARARCRCGAEGPSLPAPRWREAYPLAEAQGWRRVEPPRRYEVIRCPACAESVL